MECDFIQMMTYHSYHESSKVPDTCSRNILLQQGASLFSLINQALLIQKTKLDQEYDNSFELAK
jgi:hypothetical protein